MKTDIFNQQRTGMGARTCWALAFVLAAATVSHAANSTSKDSASDKESQLIAVLKSHAPAKDKAVPCKQLAIYGTKRAVPALAPLLLDPQLASWARIALEAIPDRSADDALRRAMRTAKGDLLAGVINSIGVRHDTNAVSALAGRLTDSNLQVVAAAADSLGRIGGTKAAAPLEKALARAPAQSRPAIAEGCVLAAEHFMKLGRSAEAVHLYDLVSNATLPEPIVLEATRGAILARQSDGLPLLLETLASPNKAMRGIALRTARELPGLKVTEALSAEMRRAAPERQPLLLLAIAERNDDAVWPALLDAAKTGQPALRLAAVKSVDRLANSSTAPPLRKNSRGDNPLVPVLLDAAASDSPAVSQAAINALARLPASDTDADLLARLSQSGGTQRKVLIQVAAQRRVDAAIPALMKSAQEEDPAVRKAAFDALGVMGTQREAGQMVALLPSLQAAKDRDALEAALIAICGRDGAGCAPHLLPLARSSDSALRIVALHALAGAGGHDALAAVRAAVDDTDEAVQDEAVRTLSNWPGNWPEDAEIAEPLLELATSGKKESHQVLAARGYLEFIKGDKRLKSGEKADKIGELLPALKRPEERRQAVAALEAAPGGASLKLLVSLCAEPAVASEADSAILVLAAQRPAVGSNEQRRTALEAVVTHSQDDATRKKAEDLLKKIR